MADREEEERHLAEADQHIGTAEKNIRNQQKILEELQADGHPTEKACALLSTMLDIFATMKAHRALVLKTLADMDKTPHDPNFPPSQD